MRECYLAAEQLARQAKASNLFYPAMNRMAADIILRSGDAGWEGLRSDELKEVRQNLVAKSQTDPDFWSQAGLIELDVYKALAYRNNAGEVSGKLAAALDGIQRRFQDLHARVSSPRMWSSVYDQARFVLEKYIQNVRVQPEKDAAKKLLAFLQELAAGTRAYFAAGSG
jgi:hypothetical protein